MSEKWEFEKSYPELQISPIYFSIWLFREIYRETANMNFLLKLLLFMEIGMLVK